MKTKAAVVYEVGKPIEIEELDLDGPQAGEVLIRYTHAGLCHSDVHIAHGDLEARLPMVLGHEGAGIIEDVGPGVTRVQAGDHVVCSFIPNCGTCRWCSTGQQAICDMGATILEGYLPGEHFPFSGPQGQYGAMCMLGTFSQYSVIHQNSVIKVDDDLPLDKAVLVGCGVPTGWGAAVNAADVRPGETVIVAGVGGIGINAVQGARIAGARKIIAVDPVPFKLEQAKAFGATHTFSSLEEAIAGVGELTLGQMCDSVICTYSVMRSDLLEPALTLTAKGGNCVVTSVAPIAQGQVDLNLFMLAMMNKQISGSIYGSESPRTAIPKLLNLYRDGILKLDELITKTYTLDEVNQGYADLEDGKILRGALTFS